MAQNNNISTIDINDYRSRLNNIFSNMTIPQGFVAPSRPTPLLPNTPYNPQTNSASRQNNPAPSTSITPTNTGGGQYTVRGGDTLSRIAQNNGMSLSQLLSLNPQYRSNPNLIRVGERINLSGGTNTPASGGNPSPTPNSGLSEGAFARMAGEAGFSPNEYQNLSNARNFISQAESDQIAKELGITALEGTLFAKPSQSSQEIYDRAYSSAGLAEVKTKINELNKKINAKRQDLTEAIGAIDENPFLTEASRVGRGKRVLDQGEQEINNLLLQVGEYQDAYNQGINEIEAMIKRNNEDFGLNNDIDTAKLNYLLAKQETMLDRLLKSKGAGGIDEYVKAYSTGQEPNLVGSASTGYYRWDNTTKKYVQVIAPSAGSSSSSDSNFKPSSSEKSTVGKFVNSQAGASLGFTAEDKQKLYTDPDFFYWTLNKANEAGFYE